MNIISDMFFRAYTFFILKEKQTRSGLLIVIKVYLIQFSSCRQSQIFNKIN